MTLLQTLLAELLGLFVDDWAFALLVLLWIGAAALLRALLGFWTGPLLFAGLAALVLIFVVRRARR